MSLPSNSALCSGEQAAAAAADRELRLREPQFQREKAADEVMQRNLDRQEREQDRQEREAERQQQNQLFAALLSKIAKS